MEESSSCIDLAKQISQQEIRLEELEAYIAYNQGENTLYKRKSVERGFLEQMYADFLHTMQTVSTETIVNFMARYVINYNNMLFDKPMSKNATNQRKENKMKVYIQLLGLCHLALSVRQLTNIDQVQGIA